MKHGTEGRKAGLARPPAKGRCGAEISGLNSSGVLVSGCPGPGGSWENLAVPPPSKEGESPSNKVLMVLLVLFGGGELEWNWVRLDSRPLCLPVEQPWGE
jgi:hypothetical protein